MTEGATNGNTDEEEAPVLLIEPNPFWRKNAEDLVGKIIPSYNDIAKQLIFVDSLLPGIYFNAIALSNVVKTSRDTALIYLSPLAFWLISLFFAFLSLYPKHEKNININSSADSKAAFIKIGDEKHKYILISISFLLFSFVLSMISFWHYLTHYCN